MDSFGASAGCETIHRGQALTGHPWLLLNLATVVSIFESYATDWLGTTCAGLTPADQIDRNIFTEEDIDSFLRICFESYSNHEQD